MKEESNGKSGKQKKAPEKKTATSSNGLQKLFEDQLKDIYWAEKALTKAIPKMIENTTSQDLVDALTQHLEVTERQVTRCEEVFETINVKAVGKKCEAMEGLIKEGSEIMEETEEGSARDAGIICAAQKVEHYEIATYGTLAALARRLGHGEAADLLETTLEEEKEADSKLNEVAESCVNEDAMSKS